MISINSQFFSSAVLLHCSCYFLQESDICRNRVHFAYSSIPHPFMAPGNRLLNGWNMWSMWMYLEKRSSKLKSRATKLWTATLHHNMIEQNDLMRVLTFTTKVSAVIPPSGRRCCLHSCCSFLQFMMVLSVPANIHSIQHRDRSFPLLSRSTLSGNTRWLTACCSQDISPFCVRLVDFSLMVKKQRQDKRESNETVV